MTALLAFFTSRLGKAVAGVGAVALVLAMAYLQGRGDCGKRHARKAAQESAEWAEKIRVSEATAYAKGLQDAKSDARNEETVDDITRDASEAPDANNACVSAGAVERLRDIQ